MKDESELRRGILFFPDGDWNVLQEKANKALGCLLVTRSSLDACQRRWVSDFGMALCQIESETTKAIKGVRGLCAHTIWDMETCQTALISKAEVWHAACIKEIEDDCTLASAEAENYCSTAIREAKSSGTSKAHSIQQSHAKVIQCLEVEAIEEEGKDHLAFLATCSTALRASPPKAHGIMVTPLPPTTRKCSYIYPAEYSPRGIPLNGNLPCRLLLSLPQHWPDSHPSPSSSTTCLTGWSPIPI